MKELSLRDIQSVSLNILKYAHELCEKNEIRYWLIYGTLLGAVRHKGFIPWDDDIDIAMTRDDYNLFLEVLKQDAKKENNPFYLDHFTTSVDYPYYILRICDSRYKLVFENTKHISGIFIDVYPFDDTGINVRYWKNRLKKTQFLKKLMLLSTYRHWLYGDSVFHKILNLPLMFYSRIMGIAFFMERIDYKSKIFNGTNSGYIGLTAWADVPRIYQKELFDNLILAKFEDLDVYIPVEYDKILRSVYGDYMKLPVKEEQVPHHNYKAYKLESEM